MGASVALINKAATIRKFGLTCSLKDSSETSLQSDLVYPNSLAPIKMCSDCETCRLLNHCK